MTVNKGHKEFYAIDLDDKDWHRPPGYPEGMAQLIIAGGLDEDAKTGPRTRL